MATKTQRQKITTKRHRVKEDVITGDGEYRLKMAGWDAPVLHEEVKLWPAGAAKFQ